MAGCGRQHLRLRHPLGKVRPKSLRNGEIMGIYSLLHFLMHEVGPSRLPRATAASVHPVAHSCKLPASMLFSRTLMMMMRMMCKPSCISYLLPEQSSRRFSLFLRRQAMSHMQGFNFRATNGVSCRARTGCCVGTDPATNGQCQRADPAA